MVDSKDIKNVLGKLVSQLEGFCVYADALYLENRTQVLSKDKTGIENRVDADAGVKIRAFDGHQYHEVCVQGWQPQLLSQELQRLISKLKQSPPKMGKPLTLRLDKEQIDKDFVIQPKIDPTTVGVEEKTALITRFHDRTLSYSKDFVNCRAGYREEYERKVFVSKAKRLSSVWRGCLLTVVPFIQTAQGQTRYDFFSKFSSGFEVKDVDDGEFTQFLERARRVKEAKRITPGKYLCILSPHVTGMLAHESFGHGMESDTIMKGRAKAEEYLGKRVAPAKVNICDDPGIPGTHGFVFFDDEGQIARRIYLVQSGTVTDPITESYSAWKRGFSRSANGRAESFDHKVYARMTNTFFLAGKDDPKQMIKDVKNGLYLHHSSSGMEDPKGWGVQIAGILAERIKNGKLTGEMFYEATMSGFLPTILSNISAVGKDFKITDDAGFCGKGHKEWVRVSSGGPHMTIKELDLS